MPTPARWTRTLTLGLLLAGCATSPRRVADERAAADWALTLSQVRGEVAAGRYTQADQLLQQFQAAHRGSSELADAGYLRALYKLDPSNPAPAAPEAKALLDELLATAPTTPRRADALVLRRIAAMLESRPAPVAAPATGGAPAAASPTPRTEDTRAKDEEIARLKDEVAKANAELERIKRRVANP